MSIWSQLLEMAQRAFEPDLASAGHGPQDGCAPDRDDLGFAAAIVGLSAKMARADGRVTQDEVDAFLRVFRPDPGEENSVRRVFQLAQQTVAGFESYAKRIGQKYRDRPCLLEDVLDGLFVVASADGAVTAREIDYLETVSQHFGFKPSTFRRIKAAHLGPDAGDPYVVLGLQPGASWQEVRRAYRRLAADQHPDSLAARGAPSDFLKLAHVKMAALNEAYAQIRAEMGETGVEQETESA